MRHVLVMLALLAACDESGRQAPGDGDVIGDDATDAPVDGSLGAALSATPTALTFTALIGTTAPSSAVFMNTGGSTSGALSLVLGGASAAPFAIGMTTCTGVLAAGSTCTARVDYTPPAASTSTATLTLSDGTATVTVTLTGTGSNTAGLTATPTLRDYGTVPLGSTSSSFSFTIRNVGTAASAGLGVAFDSGSAGDFLLAANLCAGAVVAPHATCTFSASFKPTAIGARAATLRISDSTSGAAVGVTLVGNGITPITGLTFTPTAFDFGAVTVGNSAFAHQFTLTNTGGSTTGTISTSTGGPNLGDFLKMADNCNGQTLGPGAACSLFVAFEPGAAGARTARVTAVATPGGTAAADLSGTGN